MSTFDPELEAKGKEGEECFKKWLDSCGHSYVHINQSPETFAALFKPGVVKRPDFFVLINSIGLLAVDVKNRAIRNDEFTLPIAKELKPTLAFERIFRLPVWYAYRYMDGRTEEWCWISALRAAEVGIADHYEGEDFLRISRGAFARLRTAEDFGELFKQIILNIEDAAYSIRNELRTVSDPRRAPRTLGNRVKRVS